MTMNSISKPTSGGVNRTRVSRVQAGISLMETMISTLILGIGVLAAAQTMITGVTAVIISQDQLVAKQKAREALESIFTARNTQNVVWADVRNVSDGGIFVEGLQALREGGADGIINTADDPVTLETLRFPGPDGVFDSADDETRSLARFQRSITISDVMLDATTVDPDIRQIEIQIQYSVRGFQRTVTLGSMVSRFS